MLKLGSCDKSFSWILIRVWTCSDQSKSILSGEFWQNAIQMIRNKMASAYVSILCLQGEMICSVGPQIIFCVAEELGYQYPQRGRKEEWRKMGNLQTVEIQCQIMLKDLEGFSLFHIFAREDTFTPRQDIWQHLRQEWGTLRLFILHTTLCFNVFQDHLNLLEII